MCANDFARDLEALAFFARAAERFSAEARRLRFTAVVATLAESVALELDLRMEAAAASELYERTRGEEQFRVPHIDWSRTAASVLTSEWIDGISVRDTAAIAAAGHDPKRVAVLVMRSFLTQALRDGFFHADMHPGNLFIDAQGRLAAVDFGIMGRLDAGMRRFMAGTLAGFLQRDYRNVAELHYEFAFVPPHHSLETFAQALRAIGEPIFGKQRPRRLDRPPAGSVVRNHAPLRHAGPAAAGAAAEDHGGGGRGLPRPGSGLRHLGGGPARGGKMGERQYGPGSGADPRRRNLGRAGQAGPGPAATGQERRRTVADGGGRRGAPSSRHRDPDRRRAGTPRRAPPALR